MPVAEFAGAQPQVRVAERRVAQAEAEGVRRLHALRGEVAVADPDVVVVDHFSGAIAAERAAARRRIGPSSTLPGKLADEGTSSHFSGNVVASLPDGGIRPVSTSAIAWPASCPGCQASRMASGRSRQLAVSTTPPMFRTTTTFLPLAWKADGHVADERRLGGRQLEVAFALPIRELAGQAADCDQRRVGARSPARAISSAGSGHLGRQAASA